jgi:hypothetical protein
MGSAFELLWGQDLMKWFQSLGPVRSVFRFGSNQWRSQPRILGGGAASSFFLLQPPFSSSSSTSNLGGLRGGGSMVVAAVGGALAPAAPPLPSPLAAVAHKNIRA